MSLEEYRDRENPDDKYLTLFVGYDKINPDLIKTIDKTFDEISPLLENNPGWILLTPDFRG